MTSKVVASSLTSLLVNDVTKTILNRSEDITPAIDEVQSWWGYDLLNRRPSPAYNEYGIFQGTDLDLACFLYALSSREAVINLPEYHSHTKSKIREDQQLISKQNRHGKLVGVGGNKDFFSFHMKIIDENIIGEDKVGYPRTFSLTDKIGNWYEGWKRIEFVPTLKENRFLTENKLWSGHTIHFKNFVHPNRWISVFGQHYVITRLLMDRLEDQASFLNNEIKRLLNSGIKYPGNEGPKSYDVSYGDSKQEKFPAFEMKVYIPEAKYIGEYIPLKNNQDELVSAYRKRKHMIYSVVPQLRFMTRASEFAHFKSPDRFPSWIKNVKWEGGFKLPKGRIEYERLKLFQDKVGELSVSLLKRSYEKSATVAD